MAPLLFLWSWRSTFPIPRAQSFRSRIWNPWAPLPPPFRSKAKSLRPTYGLEPPSQLWALWLQTRANKHTDWETLPQGIFTEGKPICIYSWQVPNLLGLRLKFAQHVNPGCIGSDYLHIFHSSRRSSFFESTIRSVQSCPAQTFHANWKVLDRKDQASESWVTYGFRHRKPKTYPDL